MTADHTTDLVERTMATAREQDVKFIDLQFTDVVGAVKSVTIPIEQFGEAIDHGKWFDGSSIEGFTRIAESDMFLVPDLSTFAVIPWQRGENTTARVICWVHGPEGSLFEGDPRVVLRRQLDEAAALGYAYNTGPELEFFLFKTNGGPVAPIPHDAGGYFDLTEDLGSGVRKEMVRALEAMGIEVETSHHEVAVGQHEIDFKYADALTTADNAVTLRYTLKAVAQRYDLHATFMPKPLEGMNGSGMHTHQSLSSLASGKNAFVGVNEGGDDNVYGLSKLARHFIAGQLAHARGMCAVLAPTINSYKRLVPGFEAPVYLSWARTNRSALIRIPRITPSQPAATRVELRCPDPSANPYLAFAVMLAAGLDGIRRELEPPDPMEENLYHLSSEGLAERGVHTLPFNLGEALEELERDEVVCAALGKHVLSHFREAKVQEWNSYGRHVSTWEIERYLEIL